MWWPIGVGRTVDAMAYRCRCGGSLVVMRHGSCTGGDAMAFLYRDSGLKSYISHYVPEARQARCVIL